jgi:hypothetical protein
LKDDLKNLTKKENILILFSIKEEQSDEQKIY